MTIPKKIAKFRLLSYDDLTEKFHILMLLFQDQISGGLNYYALKPNILRICLNFWFKLHNALKRRRHAHGLNLKLLSPCQPLCIYGCYVKLLHSRVEGSLTTNPNHYFTNPIMEYDCSSDSGTQWN